MTTLAAKSIGHAEGLGAFRPLAFAIACFLAWSSGLSQKPSLAADSLLPSFRAWQRSNEGQLTIEWSTTARLQHERVGDRLILRFAQPPSAEARTTLKGLTNFVAVDRTAFKDNELALALKPGVFSKVGVQSERIVTVDFSRDPATAPQSNIVVAAIDNGIRLILDWPGPTRVETTEDINRFDLDVVPPRQLDKAKLADLSQSLRPWFHNLGLETHPDRTTLSFVLKPEISSSIQQARADQTIIDFVRTSFAFPEPAAGPDRQVFIPAKRPVTQEVVIETAAAMPPIPKMRPIRKAASITPTQVESKGSKIVNASYKRPKNLVIEWSQPVAAAVFFRAGHLWAVFDQPDASLLTSFPRSPSAFGPGSIVPADGGIALRFPLLYPVNVRVSQTDKGHWKIEPVSSLLLRPRSLTIEHGEGSASLRITPVSGENIVSLIDPDVGDQLHVLPFRDLGIGQPTRRRFVDLDLLPTTRGVVWRRLNDELTAEVSETALAFGKPSGLSLSKIMPESQDGSEPTNVDVSPKEKPGEAEPNRPSSMAQSEKKASLDRSVARPAMTDKDPLPIETSPSSYVNLAKSGVERELAYEYRRIRRQAIAKAAPENRDRARLDLARLLVSERLGTEARIVLDAISDDADDHVVRQKRALDGISAFLIGQHAKASTLLFDPDLNKDTEIDVWRAALESSENQWQAAAERWRNTNEILDVYPPRLKLDLGLMALKSAIETNDNKMIRRGMRRLTSLQLDAYDQARFDAVRALKAERSGDVDKARALLTALTDSPNPKVRTLADFELAALDLAMDADDMAALAALDRRMPLWRGHPEEQAMLDKLARRYRDANALRKALTIWRRLLRLYPEATKNKDIRMARQNAFMQALANLSEPALDRIDVYSIYLDFTDLIPADPEAREVHRHLARHLTELDLLDEAIDVLQSLMTSTSDDQERAEFGTEIAALMLRQDRAAPAIAILDSTGSEREAGLPALKEKRLLIRGEALARLGRADDALRAIRDLQSQAARRLRAKIFWSERRWRRLAAAVEAYFADTDPTQSLSEDEQELVLWLALARQKGEDPEQLSDLRNRYAASMQEGLYGEAFNVATQGAINTSDIRSLLARTGDQLAEIERFRKATPVIQ